MARGGKHEGEHVSAVIEGGTRRAEYVLAEEHGRAVFPKLVAVLEEQALVHALKGPFRVPVALRAERRD